jgi:hypothetical protein
MIIMDQWNDELNSLFGSYKASMPDPEASANFMPELWRRIEARRNVLLRFKKLTQMFLAAAAALSVIFVTMLSVPAFSHSDTSGSYIEVLADAYPTEGLASHGILPHEFEANTK